MQSTIVTHTFYLRTQRASNKRKRIFIYNINVFTKAKNTNEKRTDFHRSSFCSGSLTRTDDLWVMSPTSYQLLHPAIFDQNFFHFASAKIEYSFYISKYKMINYISPLENETNN